MTWRETILSKFVREAGRLTLVADPDGLLTEEGVLAGLQERGFSLLTFEDPVIFRLAYETRFRSHWDLGTNTELVVALRTASADISQLPFDLVATGRPLAFSLDELFPTLNPGVLAELDYSQLDAAESALEASGSSEERGPIGTAEFLLIYLYQWSPAQTTPEQIVAWLLTHHYHNRSLPRALAEHAAKVWRRQPELTNLPLIDWLLDSGKFLGFIQSEWQRFVAEKLPTVEGVREPTSTYEAGSFEVPFSSGQMRVILDNCFADGLLRPVSLEGRKPHLLPDQAWMQCGIMGQSPQQRAERALSRAADRLPEPDAPHQQWQAYARTWASARAAVASLPAADRGSAQATLENLRDQADHRFQAWALQRFGLLSSLPANPPVMAHQIVHWLQQQREETAKRYALVVLDGLAWDHWLIIRDYLAQRQPGWACSDHSTYSWIPTITRVSRLSLFTGMPPLAGGIEGSIHRETKGWTNFWRDAGLQAHRIGYHNVSLLPGEAGNELNAINADLDHYEVVGIVVRAIDELMHGEHLGEAGLLSHVRDWLDHGALEQLFSSLFEAGLSIVVTSDHGCLEATGVGKPNQGVLLDERGQRACLYTSEEFRQDGLAQFPDAIAWTDVGLPSGTHYLLANGRTAFLPTGTKQVVHGGLTIDEVVVPCISLSVEADHS